MTTYQQRIKDLTDESFDPRHVEAWMRIEHSTLDHLSAGRFRDETIVAVDCILAAGADKSERLAKSMGL